jgi:hypothetical protein
VEDLGSGRGHLTVGGVTEADGQWIQASGNWSNVQYVGGSSAGTDQLEVAVYDATTGSFIYSSNFGATTSHVNPTVTAQNFSVSRNQAVSLASELSVSNPSGDSLTSYWVEDLGGGRGHLTVGGVRKADRQWVQTTSNWSNVKYFGGSSAGTDQLEVAVYDATTGSLVFSSNFSATTSTRRVGRAATVSAASQSQARTVFEYSAGSGQYTADLVAGMIEGGDSATSGALAAALSDQSGHCSQLGLLYTQDDWSSPGRMLDHSSARTLFAQNSSGLLYHDTAKPLLGSADSHAEIFGNNSHSSVFAAPSRSS